MTQNDKMYTEPKLMQRTRKEPFGHNILVLFQECREGRGPVYCRHHFPCAREKEAHKIHHYQKISKSLQNQMAY